jgi:hypothetical protein
MENTIASAGTGITQGDIGKGIALIYGLGGVLTRVAPVYIGGLPLYLVNNIEVGWSDRTLKYRSSGLLFLAHQKGEYDGLAIRVQFKLLGEQKNIILQYLDGLRRWSRARTTDLIEAHGDEIRKKYHEKFDSYIATGRNFAQAHKQAVEDIAREYNMVQSNALDWNQMQSQLAEAVSGVASFGYSVTLESINPFQEAKTSVGTHKPLPFVSRLIVLRNVYIETFTITNESQNKDMYNCELMIRKYVSPGDIESLLTGHHWGLQETDKVDKWNTYLNYILRIGGAVMDIAKLRVSISSIIDIFGLLSALPTNMMPLKEVSSIPSEFISVFSPNPGDMDLSDYEWDSVNYNSHTFPFVEEYGDYRFAFDKMTTWRRSLSGKNEMDIWVRLTIFDENGEIVFNEKIVDRLMYTVGDMQFFFKEVKLLPTAQEMKMWIRSGD